MKIMLTLLPIARVLSRSSVLPLLSLWTCLTLLGTRWTRLFGRPWSCFGKMTLSRIFGLPQLTFVPVLSFAHVSQRYALSSNVLEDFWGCRVIVREEMAIWRQGKVAILAWAGYFQRHTSTTQQKRYSWITAETTQNLPTIMVNSEANLGRRVTLRILLLYSIRYRACLSTTCSLAKYHLEVTSSLYKRRQDISNSRLVSH